MINDLSALAGLNQGTRVKFTFKEFLGISILKWIIRGPISVAEVESCEGYTITVIVEALYVAEFEFWLSHLIESIEIEKGDPSADTPGTQ